MLCIYNTYETCISRMNGFHPNYYLSFYLYVFICVLTAWYPCAKTMNIWKTNFTQLSLPKHKMQNLWCIVWAWSLDFHYDK
jgi:hypothetical protein